MTVEMPRDALIRRMREDLMGPREVDETLAARPSDVYLTGILWPRNTAISPDEDERLSVAVGGGDDDGDDTPEQVQARSVGMRRPSTAGISFAVTATLDQRPTVDVQLEFGTYSPSESGGRNHWSRRQNSIGPIEVALDEPAADISLDQYGFPELRLNSRTVPFERGLLSTLTLVNDAMPAEQGRAALEQATIFQVSVDIRAGSGCRLISRPSRRSPVDEEDWSSALLYRHAREYAAGHTCSADWVETADGDGATLVRTEWIPETVVAAVTPDGHAVFADLNDGVCQPLSANWLAACDHSALPAALRRLCDAYERWILIQQDETGHLRGKLADAATRHLAEAEHILDRMRGGVRLLETDPACARAFRLANLAMTTQRQWAGLGELIWRPFQLGFLLLTIESAALSEHPDRDTMDLLWFPTGGGKTEAYLGLIAFIAFHRRLSRPNADNGAGVSVIMRYTLRLLTTQQFIRAAAMICACEVIRRGKFGPENVTGLGDEPFSIGLWVGENSTPNTRQSAFNSRTDDSRSSPEQLLECPCCRKALNYHQPLPADPVQIFCRTADCTLAGSTPLPVWTVDEDVYAARPTLLVGTIDKFAQIVRNSRTAVLFAVGSKAQPQLILQDELHLISGPLGTLAGLYESALDLILSADGTRPKIIGSTATIRRAPEQVRALFDRKTCQFPPPGLSADDSGFTVVDPSLPGRRYVGITTAGRSAKFTLQAAAASLLQSAFAGLPPEHQDHYWTLVAYFNSLRELGGALVLMQDDVHDSIRLFADARHEERRTLQFVEELTSRRTQKEITGMLSQLERKAGHPEAVDVLLATNMVSVGVDISRLGLMLVNGQPKTMAEYIQATSRVGRGSVSGLVIPVLNNAKPRDRSHYETFRTWHSTLYREVEATSVTPFASRARDRALHAVLVAIIRHLAAGMLDSPVLNDSALDAAEELILKVGKRAKDVDPLETDVETELRERLNRWRRRAPQVYWNEYKKDTLLQSAEAAAAKRAAGRVVGQAWPTPNSMRGVEPSTNYRLAEGLRRKTDGTV
ncbi:helicase-like protein [Rhizobium subbaraonis]|uniref:Helicase-like protein n=1 Tax=Rhizobium subbaraonis TaxID=908946 RepID=A0A285UUV0_9HYPH|nr:helicase-related protein [Rhizobium subbaraonis]SOC45563.1 helicase-like protein [Rhizobium subbaraonis]